MPKFGDYYKLEVPLTAIPLTATTLNDPNRFPVLWERERTKPSNSKSVALSKKINPLIPSSQEYKVPDEKYVVVVNAWGLPEDFGGNPKMNEVGAWFKLLLKKDYPNATVREIFYQKTVWLFDTHSRHESFHL